jgi:hypothetical protein
VGAFSCEDFHAAATLARSPRAPQITEDMCMPYQADTKKVSRDLSGTLRDVLPLLADLLGLSVFRLAPVSLGYRVDLLNDTRICAAALSGPVHFSDLALEDEAASAVFKCFPSTLVNLDMSFRSFRKNQDNAVSRPALKGLAEQLPRGLRCLHLKFAPAPSILHDFDRIDAETLEMVLAKSARSLTQLTLQASLEKSVFTTLSKNIPPKLKMLSLELGPFLEADEPSFEFLLDSLPEILTQLNLGLEEVVPRGAISHLVQRLPSLRNLQILRLNLRLNELEMHEIEALLASVPSGLIDLDLDLAHSELNSSAIVDTFRKMLRSMRQLKKLRLCFDNCTMDEKLPHCVVSSLSDGVSELSIDFGSCGLRRQHVWQIGDALAGLTSLQKLHLNFTDCCVTGGCWPLATNMPTSLESLHLDFSKSDMEDPDVLAFAHVLPQHLQQLQLKLGMCGELTSQGIQYWFDSLPHELTHLQLEFEWHNLAHVCCDSLPKSLKFLQLSPSAKHEGTTGTLDTCPFLSSLSASFGQLHNLHAVQLDFAMCGINVQQAKLITEHLPKEPVKVALDFGSQLAAKESPEEWNAILGPFLKGDESTQSPV